MKVTLTHLLFWALLVTVFFHSCAPAPVEPEPTTGTISGVVTEALTGYSVAQVLVTTTNSSSSVTSDVDGYFEISNVAPGDYTLLASRNGFEEKLIQVTVTAGISTKADFILERIVGVRITGKVTDRVNNTRIEGALVATNPFIDSDITSEFGRFNINSVPPGNYTITASSGEFIEDSKQITVENGKDSLVLSFELTPRFGSITGFLRTSNSNNPILGATISTIPATTTVVSDSSGRFNIPRVQISDGGSIQLQLLARKAGFAQVTENISVEAGRETTVNLQMRTFGVTIQGRVIDAISKSAINGSQISTSPFVGSDNSSTNGEYSINNVPAGEYVITANYGEYNSQSHTVIVSESQEVIQLNFNLVPIYGTISGVIRNVITNEPIRGANVFTDPASSSVLTDETGAFTIERVLTENSANTDYSITVQHPDFTAATRNISVSPGRQTVADIFLQPLVTGGGN